MQSRVRRRATTLALSLTLVAVGMFIAPVATLAAPVSTTVHRQIGFQASVPFDETKSDSEDVCAPFCVEVASYEVRAVGTTMGLDDEFVWRQPFPGPGLAVRLLGPITRDRLDLLRRADAIVVDEVRRLGRVSGPRVAHCRPSSTGER